MGHKDLSRYRDLIGAVKQQANLHGVTIDVEEYPCEAHCPAVFLCSHASSADSSLLFLFFPSEPLLTSDVLMLMFKKIDMVSKNAPPPLALLSESNLAVVHRALRAVGLTKHCTIGTYLRTKDGYEVKWPLVPSDATLHGSEPAQPRLVPD